LAAATGVLTVMDGYRVTGPAQQVLASARHGGSTRVTTSFALFQRTPTPTPLIEAARGIGASVRVLPDRFPGDPLTMLKLAAMVRTPEVHILETHGYKANVLGFLVAKSLRRPWVAVLHGETWENRKVRAYFALERLAVRRADCVVTVSHDMARKMVSRGVPASKIQVVHNACLVHHEGDPLAWSDQAPPVIGVVARLSPEKGVDVALQVHRVVVRRLPGARMLVAGEGPTRAALERQARELGIESSVCFLGHREPIGSVYEGLTALLIPSRSEGLPNVVLEAMSRGVPVVATSVGGLPEVIENGESGFLAPSGDVEALAAKVLRLLEDPLARRHLGQRARREMTSRFSLPARIEALHALYDRLKA